MTYPYSIQNQKLSKAMTDWLNELTFTHAMTLAFNQKRFQNPHHNIQFARDKLKYFHCKLDRCLLGSSWHKKPQEQRTFFIAFPEKISTNIHYHLLIRVNDQHESKFNKCAEGIWKSIVNSGTYDCKSLKNSSNAKGWASYATKDQYRNMNFNSFIVSREFS